MRCCWVAGLIAVLGGLACAADSGGSSARQTGGIDPAAGVGGSGPAAGQGPISVPGSSGGFAPIVPIEPLADAGVAPLPMKPSTEPIAIDECAATNAAGLAATDVQKLKAGGTGAAPQLLYPYAGTIFPRGVLAPLIMWADMPAEAVFVHIKSQAFEYSAA